MINMKLLYKLYHGPLVIILMCVVGFSAFCTYQYFTVSARSFWFSVLFLSYALIYGAFNFFGDERALINRLSKYEQLSLKEIAELSWKKRRELDTLIKRKWDTTNV